MILLAIGYELAKHRINAHLIDGRADVLCSNHRISITVVGVEARISKLDDKLGCTYKLASIDMNDPESLDQVTNVVRAAMKD